MLRDDVQLLAVLPNPAAGALVARHVDLVVVHFFYRRLGLCCESFGLALKNMSFC